MKCTGMHVKRRWKLSLGSYGSFYFSRKTKDGHEELTFLWVIVPLLIMVKVGYRIEDKLWIQFCLFGI